MKTKTTTSNRTKSVVHTCKACSKSFRTASSSKVTCNAICRKRLQRKEQAKIQKMDFDKTSFGWWLIMQCKRASTTQILQGVDIHALYDLWSKYNKYNGFNNGGDDRYCLSHIAPVKNDRGVVALLHPQNLVIAPTSFNLSYGNTWDGVSGKWLPNEQLDASLSIYEGMTTQQILASISKALGKDEFDSFLEANKLAITYKAKLVKKLKGYGCTVDVSPSTEAEVLTLLLAQYEDNEDNNCSFGIPRTPEIFVFWQESVRLGKYTEQYEKPDWQRLHTEHPAGCFAYKLEAKPDIDYDSLFLIIDDKPHIVEIEIHHGTTSLIETFEYVPASVVDVDEGINSRSYRWPKNLDLEPIEF